MNKIKRYKIIYNVGLNETPIKEDQTGKFILYEDYEKLLKENNFIKLGIEGLRNGEISQIGFLAIFPLRKVTKECIEWAKNVLNERKK